MNRWHKVSTRFGGGSGAWRLCGVLSMAAAGLTAVWLVTAASGQDKDDPEYAPPGVQVLTDQLKGDLEEVLAGYGIKSVEFIIVADEAQGEATAFHPEGNVDFEITEGEFVLPEVGTNFEWAACSYSTSPATLVNCGRLHSGSGTRRCERL